MISVQLYVAYGQGHLNFEVKSTNLHVGVQLTPYIQWHRAYYIGPSILRPPSKPEKSGLKLKVVLKWRDICIENV